MPGSYKKRNRDCSTKAIVKVMNVLSKRVVIYNFANPNIICAREDDLVQKSFMEIITMEICVGEKVSNRKKYYKYKFSI